MVTDTFDSSNSLEERQRPWILAPTMQAWLEKWTIFWSRRKGGKNGLDHDLKEGPEKKKTGEV